MPQNQQPPRPHRGWRERFGLAGRPAEPDEWVVLASGPVDDAVSGHSVQAQRVHEAVHAAGIESRLQPYVVPDGPGIIPAVIGGAVSRGVTDRIRVAVLVRRHDLDRARAAAAPVEHELLAWHDGSEAGGISDEELTRLSMSAGDALSGEPS